MSRPGSLLVIFLVVFIDLLGFGMVLPLLPIYADQFIVDESGWQLGALMASFSLMQFLFAPVWGRLSDRIGRRPVLMLGLAGSVAFYALFGIGTVMASYWVLLLSRIGAGIAGATISTAQAYIADSTTPENRSKGMALIGMAFGIGFTFGPLFGFLAVPNGSGDPGPWPGYLAAILSAVAFGLAYFLLPESRTPESDTAAKSLFARDAFRQAISVPSIGFVLMALFICVFSFANFETTLSLLIKGPSSHAAVATPAAEPAATTGEANSAAPSTIMMMPSNKSSPFHFGWGQVCLTYAFIGLTLAIVQGGIVRRLGGRVSEGTLTLAGAALQVIGFGVVMTAISIGSVSMLFAALAVIVTGFSFMQPNLNALLSRRSDPSRQGVILGLGQSTSALARIVGSVIGIPLLRAQIYLPYLMAAGLMVLGALLVTLATSRGSDFAADETRDDKTRGDESREIETA